MVELDDKRTLIAVMRLSKEWSANYAAVVGWHEFLETAMGIKVTGDTLYTFAYQIVDEKTFAWYWLSHE